MPTAIDEGLIREQIEDILRQRGSVPFTTEDADRLERLDAQLQGMLQDRSLGRIMTGPLWLSGTSVVDNTITADKLIVNSIDSITINTGDLNVTGDIIAAPTYPSFVGPRIVINSSAIAGYNATNVNTFRLNVDGSGFIGTGLGQMSWTAGGALTVPAAAIGSLTIAQVGSGVFTGNYDAGTGRVRAGTALQRVELTSVGLKAYDSAGSQTFSVSASDGSLDMVGLFSLRNASSGNRVEISNVGLRGFNATQQTFSLSASNGSGFIGVGSTISWNSAGTVSIPGSLLVGGTIDATKLNVSTLSAISANMGTITAGSITAGTVSASTITTGSLVYGSGGTVNSGASVSGTFGGLNLANLTVTGTITIGSGGKIIDADTSEWNQLGLILKSSGGGAFGDSIQWQNGSTPIGSIYSSSNAVVLAGASSKSIQLIAGTGGGVVVFPPGGGAAAAIWQNSDYRMESRGRIYPGDGFSLGTTYYIAAGASSGIISNGIGIGGMLGISSGNTINLVAPGTGGSTPNWTGSVVDGGSWFIIQLGGNNYRVPFFANA